MPTMSCRKSFYLGAWSDVRLHVQLAHHCVLDRAWARGKYKSEKFESERCRLKVLRWASGLRL